MKKLLAYALCIIAITVLVVYFFTRPPSPPQSQAFVNGNILTLDNENTIVEAIFIEGNTISARGTTEEILQLTNKKTLVHNLNGKTLTPGFIDAHGHFPGSGMFYVLADLRSPPMGSITTTAELLEAMKEQVAKKKPGEWVAGNGYDDTLLKEQVHPTREQLDAIAPNNPVFIIHTSGHMGVANSLALKEMGINGDTQAPVGGAIIKDPITQELTGLLEETAMREIMLKSMDFSAVELKTLFFSAIDEYAAAGITTAQSGGVDHKMLTGITTVAKLGLIPFRLELWPLDDLMGDDIVSGNVLEQDFESHNVNIGAMKIIADGSIQGFTGYLSQPYHSHFRGNENHRGYPSMPRETLVKRVEQLHKIGHQMAIHGNGDAAIDDILYAFEQAQIKYPTDDPRMILIHSQMAREDQLRKMQTLGVTPSFFSAHTYYWGDRHRDMFMGPERASRMSPTRSAENLGLRFSVHMDTPIAPMEPLTMVWSTVNRMSTGGAVIGEQQRISPMSALKAVTLNAAYQIFRDHDLGSIEVGKLADLVVLNENPLTVDPMRIKDIKVEKTLVNGVMIYSH